VLKPGETLNGSSELLTLKMRYKAPDGDTSQKLEWPATDGGNSFDKATEDFRFAAAVAGFGMLLRDSQFKGDLTFKEVVTIAENSLGHDEHGYRSEFSEMVREAQRLKRD
jgi:Ca-activated chloride channel family protein